MVKGWEEENKSNPENIILFKDRMEKVKMHIGKLRSNMKK